MFFVGIDTGFRRVPSVCIKACIPTTFASEEMTGFYLDPIFQVTSEYSEVYWKNWYPSCHMGIETGLRCLPQGMHAGYLRKRGNGWILFFGYPVDTAICSEQVDTYNAMSARIFVWNDDGDRPHPHGAIRRTHGPISRSRKQTDTLFKSKNWYSGSFWTHWCKLCHILGNFYFAVCTYMHGLWPCIKLIASSE